MAAVTTPTSGESPIPLTGWVPATTEAVSAPPAREGRLDPGVVLVGKLFTEAELLSTAGRVLGGQIPAS